MTVTGTDKIEISMDDAIEIVSWWRGANEAPGGCSAIEALQGMQNSIYNVALVLREHGYYIQSMQYWC